MKSKDAIRAQKYRRTKRGLLVCAHRQMRRRVTGTQLHWLRYIGFQVIDRDQFIEWSLKDKEFNKLYAAWERNNYEYKYTPSVDRLNPSFGYTLDNINWCTVSQNTKRMHQMNRSR